MKAIEQGDLRAEIRTTSENALDPEIEERVLTEDAMTFLMDLHERFEGRRQQLLTDRKTRAQSIAAGRRLGFLDETREIRENDWQVAPAPDDLQDRRVEITGPTDAKMVINALNSGARVFMADFEDANSPTWSNMVEGQANLMDAVRGTLTFTKDDGKHYALDDDRATLVVRPRGWHLDEPRLVVGGTPISASLFDFGLYFYHNAKELIARGSGPYVYLPKLENHHEASLWNDVFVHAQETLGVPQGSVRATVLVETLPAAFEMDEILYALRDHAAGLNAGRWDYIFSTIKTLKDDPDAVLPDRSEVTMTVPFMRAYTTLLVQTCHRRGAHAMGGMAAQVPNRKDPEATEAAFDAVRSDKRREAEDGYDGTWVAHPALVPVAQAPFDETLDDPPHQKEHPGPSETVTADDLLDIRVPGGSATIEGLKTNIDVGLRYLTVWLSGRGAVAIHGLMEDTATAEISRAQVWQWLHHGQRLEDGRTVDEDLVRDTTDAVYNDLIELNGGEESRHLADARRIFEDLARAADPAPFLTTEAMDKL